MSRRTADANKAIREAWEKERDLVREGKGTRDWTPDQQRDILDPDKGKAYDDEGKAFEGQHMKSVEMYPEYQGNPSNIQFLTKKEHLDAHKGNWQNPTNWYYDPIGRNYKEFGAKELEPCEIFRLSHPVCFPTEVKLEPCHSEVVMKTVQRANSKYNSNANTRGVISEGSGLQKKGYGNKITKGVKVVGKFVTDHPVESAGIIGGIIKGVYEFFNHAKGFDNRVNTNRSEAVLKNKSVRLDVSDIVESINRAKPIANDVVGHKQRYHTRDGVIWKDKPPYHRGGKKE